MDQVLWVTRRDFELSSEHDSAGIKAEISSPTLWNIFYDPLLTRLQKEGEGYPFDKESKITHVAYADDLVPIFFLKEKIPLLFYTPELNPKVTHKFLRSALEVVFFYVCVLYIYVLGFRVHVVSILCCLILFSWLFVHFVSV